MADSDYLEAKLLDGTLGGTNFSQPATVYMRLYTAAPSDSGGGTEVSTGVWTNYSPAAITNNSTNWPAASGTSPTIKSNGVAISFGTATVSGGPPVVTHCALWDASTGGNMLKWAALTSSKTINNGDPVSFPIGDVDVTHD